jgi:hypothetical protein
MTRHVTRRRVAAAAVLAALLAWWLWPSSQLVRVQELRAAAGDPSLTPEQRRQKWDEVRRASAQLTPAERDQLAAEGRRRFESEMARYSALSPAEKKQYLDQQIDREEEMRRQMQKAGGPPPGPPAGGPPRGPQSAEDRERRRQHRLDDSTPQFRAQIDEFRKDMAQRRQQRGLPAGAGFPGRPGP